MKDCKHRFKLVQLMTSGTVPILKHKRVSLYINATKAAALSTFCWPFNGLTPSMLGSFEIDFFPPSLRFPCFVCNFIQSQRNGGKINILALNFIGFLSRQILVCSSDSSYGIKLGIYELALFEVLNHFSLIIIGHA